MTVEIFEDNAGGLDLFVFDGDVQIYAHHYLGMDAAHRTGPQACGEDLRMIVGRINAGDIIKSGDLEGNEEELTIEREGNGGVKHIYSSVDGWEAAQYGGCSAREMYGYATAELWVRYNQTCKKIEDYALIINDDDYHDTVMDWLRPDDDDDDDHGCWDGETDDYRYQRGDQTIILERAASHCEDYQGMEYLPLGYGEWEGTIEHYDSMDTLQMFPKWYTSKRAVRVCDLVEGSLLCEWLNPDCTDEGSADEPEYADDDAVIFEKD